MSVIETAHPLPDGADELNLIAHQLFGAVYTTLSDSEAAAVWDAIESSTDDH